MAAWKNSGIVLSRKSLAEIAFAEPEAFATLVQQVMKKAE